MAQPLAASAGDCESTTGLHVDRCRIALRTFKATGSDLGAVSLAERVAAKNESSMNKH
jgi:hypothetical protein